MVEFFPMVPVGTKAWAFVAGLVAFMLGITAMIVLMVWGATRAGFEISPEGLHARAMIYGRKLPHSSLLMERARHVDFRVDPDLKPRTRTNGIGLPGYLGGWIKLRNGEKALAFISDSSRVVYIPTTEGYSMMLSVCDPDMFLSRLREVAKTS
jgi:hypothetical protein